MEDGKKKISSLKDSRQKRTHLLAALSFEFDDKTWLFAKVNLHAFQTTSMRLSNLFAIMFLSEITLRIESNDSVLLLQSKQHLISPQKNTWYYFLIFLI
ncbi:hypothetical protein CEXT_450271 [Caerostris extrusa]|uniref:Uncharacterized protein n=1 Tax=Caerostris extrusa TaxID=172846 RepID=A0AAV4P3F9_CAEEX|nr:hypothetical protein CEXT_450271 [Caerostris extrusa]